ncbi:Transposase [Caenorhabditis elegans]|uniref:Transposase n=1 Tax=Caenorhabditis elegans TaxID=6239 RepID=U4PBL5_CAEEL|nr:Transposase [Caenorhabditis elegans]CDH93259.1 Transposase [Caenorhabditis elegans]|eukprot:NP_001293576.1 Uncharacterized protein CELE_C32B5.18 [Caenorhabditis elegans]
MADSKRLSYPALTCLLKHLEPNLRFQIAIM